MNRYVDPIAVERAVMGDKVRLELLERCAAAQTLTRRGLSARVIGERIGVSRRTVQRYRSRNTVEVSSFGADPVDEIREAIERAVS